MTATLLPTVHTALLDALTAGIPTVPVFDTVPNTQDYLAAAIVVGGDVDPIDPTAGQFSGDWHDLGPGASRDDRGSLRVHIVCQSGDATFTTLRTDVYAIVDAIFVILRADPTLGITTGRMCPQIDAVAGKSHAGISEYGPWLDVVLTVSYTAIT